MQGIDTIFPKFIRPTYSIAPFEPAILWGERVTTSESQSYRFIQEHNKWLAKKYSFKLNTLVVYEDGQANSVCWSLGGGCYIHTNNMNPLTGDFDDDPRYLYLVLAYRHKELWDGNPLFPRLKKWLKYLEEMPSCPIEAVYCRATDCRDKKQSHLLLTGMMLDKDADSRRLEKCYRRYFGANAWEFKDGDGKPFLKWRFQPKNPKK